MARKSTGKRQRFEIFKRDGFRCAYCGRSPPDVLLQVDHIVPVAGGGDNDDANLVTACADCNAGKSDNPLTSVAPPLADQAAVQLERAEQVRAYAEAMIEAREAKDETLEVMKEIWFRPWPLPGRQWLMPKEREVSLRQFMGLLTIAEIFEAIDIAHRAVSRGRVKAEAVHDAELGTWSLHDADAFRYFCGVCWKTIKAKKGGA